MGTGASIAVKRCEAVLNPPPTRTVTLQTPLWCIRDEGHTAPHSWSLAPDYERERLWWIR